MGFVSHYQVHLSLSLSLALSLSLTHTHTHTHTHIERDMPKKWNMQYLILKLISLNDSRNCAFCLLKTYIVIHRGKKMNLVTVVFFSMDFTKFHHSNQNKQCEDAC